MRVFNPNKPITRQEFVVLLVRAADAEDEAAEMVDDEGELDAVRADLMEMFKDGKHIGTWALGSIAYAMDQEWIECLLGGNTFNPNKPVTRAEACCMLEAAGAEMDFNWTNRYVGVITDLDLVDDEITIDPGARTFTIADGCLVRIDREPAELDDLMVGYAVKLYANETGDICIEASTEVDDEDDEDDEDDVEELIGVITNVNVGEMTIMFDVDETEGDPVGEADPYDVDEDVLVKDGAATLDFDEDLEGEHVEIKLVNGVVVRISIED
jgi:CBS domain-containing protein